MAKTKNLLVVFGIGAVLLLAGYFGAKFMAENVAEQKVKEFFAGMDDVAHAEYGKVEVGLFSREAVIHDLKVAVLGGKTIEVKEFVLSRYEEKDGLPQVVKVRFNGVALPVTPEYFGDSVEDVRSMGYETLNCEYAMDYEYKDQDKTFQLNDFSLAVLDAGQLSMTLKLANVNLKDLVAGGPSAMLVAIEGASLRYADDSLADRALRMAAADAGVTEEQLMEQFFVGIDEEIAKNRDGGEEFAAQVLEQLRRFIAGRTSLSISATPAEPVAVLQLIGLQQTADVVETLGVKVEGE